MPAVLRGVPAARRCRQLRIAALVATLSAFGGLPLHAKRNDDEVVMKNGDKFTGEIKKLENGVLFFKSDYMVNAVELDWARVERLESKDPFNVSFASGKRVIGLIEETRNSDFAVISDGANIRVPPPEIAGLVPVEESFFKQLTGSIDLGFSYTGGTNATQASLSGRAAYQGERWSVQMDGSSVLNRQSGARASGRNTFDVLYMKDVNNNWFLGSTAILLTSDQQDLTLRTTYGGGIGRNFVQSGTAGFYMLAGLVFSREKYSVGELPDLNSAETLFQIHFFRSTFKTLRFDGQVTALPSLTTPGRVRLSAQTNFQREIIRNLYLKFSVYENYDNRPPLPVPKNDFGTSTSLGWTF